MRSPSPQTAGSHWWASTHAEWASGRPTAAGSFAFLTSPLGAALVGPSFVRETLVSSVAASPDGRWVFAGCVDGTASVWELETGRLVFEATEHVEETLALLDEEDEFGWATSGGNVWVCTPGGTPRKLLATGEHWCEVAFGPGGLLARCSSGAVSHWSFTGTRTALSSAVETSDMWSYRAASLGFYGPSRYFFPENQNRLIVSVEGQRTAIDRQPRITWARFSPNGENVAVAGWSDSIELYASVDGRQVRRFSAPSSIGAVAFSPDGRMLAVGEIGEGGGRYPRQRAGFRHRVRRPAAGTGGARLADFSIGLLPGQPRIGKPRRRGHRLEPRQTPSLPTAGRVSGAL